VSVKLLANENIPLASIKALRVAGFDVLAIVEDCPSEKDSRVLALAAKEKRILITFDRDYGELIFRERMPVPPAVIFLRLIPSNPLEVGDILRRFLSTEGSKVGGRYWVIARNGVRSRDLPSPSLDEV